MKGIYTYNGTEYEFEYKTVLTAMQRLMTIKISALAGGPNMTFISAAVIPVISEKCSISA